MLFQPFHNGSYYPHTTSTQGTHLPAGIRFLHLPSVSSFHFRPRRESVDWVRVNELDVDSVVSQQDVDTLQEFPNTVTFCSLDGERCQRCRNPVDPALVKLMRLAQLTVEWLLHCQDILTLNLHEEQLAASSREQEEKLKHAKDIIRIQSLLPPPIVSVQKCPHCVKAFINSWFLQSHMQRRHPDECDRLLSETVQTSENQRLKSEVSSLKEQLAQVQQALQAKNVQEEEEKRLLRQLEQYQAEEIARLKKMINPPHNVVEIPGTSTAKED